MGLKKTQTTNCLNWVNNYKGDIIGTQIGEHF